LQFFVCREEAKKEKAEAIKKAKEEQLAEEKRKQQLKEEEEKKKADAERKKQAEAKKSKEREKKLLKSERQKLEAFCEVWYFNDSEMKCFLSLTPFQIKFCRISCSTNLPFFLQYFRSLQILYRTVFIVSGHLPEKWRYFVFPKRFLCFRLWVRVEVRVRGNTFLVKRPFR